MADFVSVISAVWHTRKVSGWMLDGSEARQMQTLEWKQTLVKVLLELLFWCNKDDFEHSVLILWKIACHFQETKTQPRACGSTLGFYHPVSTYSQFYLRLPSNFTKNNYITSCNSVPCMSLCKGIWAAATLMI